MQSLEAKSNKNAYILVTLMMTRALSLGLSEV